MSCLYDQTWLQTFKGYIPCLPCSDYLMTFREVRICVKVTLIPLGLLAKSSTSYAVHQFGDCGFEVLVFLQRGSLVDKSVICRRERGNNT